MRTIAAGLKVCSASQRTGLLVIGSVKMDFGFGSMMGAVTGRTKGPSVQPGPCAWANTELAARKRMEKLVMPVFRTSLPLQTVCARTEKKQQVPPLRCAPVGITRHLLVDCNLDLRCKHLRYK